jgi:hypothetical protein
MDKTTKPNTVERNTWYRPQPTHQPEDDPVGYGLWLDGFFWLPNEEDIDTQLLRFSKKHLIDKSIVVAKQ